MKDREIRRPIFLMVFGIIIIIIILVVVTTTGNKKQLANLDDESSVLEALNYNYLISGEYYIKSSPFANVISGNLKKYIESKIGRKLEATDIFYEVETDRLQISNENKYIFNSKLNIVIELSEQDIKDLEKPLAIWFWCNTGIADEIKYVDNPVDTVSVLNKLDKIGINIIYIPIDTENINSYSNFIKEAYNRNMYVYGLFGDPHFIFKQNYNSCINKTMDAVSQYNKSASYDAKIRGIHYDVEPYGNEEWVDGQSKSAKSNICRTSYIDFVTKAQSYAKPLGLIVGYDIPVWIDRYTFIQEGQEKNIAEEVFKLADEITIMDYGTNANIIYKGLDNRGTYKFADNTTITLTKSYSQQMETYKKNYIIGVDLATFETEAQAKIDRPELVPTYIAPDYKYTFSYINQMIDDVENRVNIFQENNNINCQFGFAYHHIYPLLELVDD
ncbi:MAG: hypothetical protein PHD15_01505 [Clostridia bacterium]|nr:hypothetical protein [Clostridia bacterium]MDD4386426.1 hypothetical protein [Clostridia bacterium]